MSCSRTCVALQSVRGCGAVTGPHAGSTSQPVTLRSCCASARVSEAQLVNGAHTHTHTRVQDAEFPIVCEDCLGEEVYLRMMKAPFDQACKVSKGKTRFMLWWTLTAAGS